MPGQVLADLLRRHCAVPWSSAHEAILAAVTTLEAGRTPATADLVDRTELAMAAALGVDIPWQRLDDYRDKMRELGEVA